MAVPLLLQLFVAMLAPVIAQIETEFTKYPESVTAPVGDEVTFECAVRVPGERLAWRWRHMDRPDEEWKEVAGTSDKERLSTRLVVLVKDDTPTSLYQCVVWYGAVSLASIPARLSIARLDISRYNAGKRVVPAPVGNTVVLHCKEPVSEPPAVLTWWRENGKGSRKQLETPHGVLIIRNVTIEDSGTYGCTATNELSGQSMDLPETTYLKVQHEQNKGTRFLETKEYVGTVDSEGVLSVSVKVNDALRLWCGAVDTVPPSVKWTNPHAETLPTQFDQALVIESFSASDEGVYSCIANPQSSHPLRRSWKVLALEPPAWEDSAVNVNASEGGSAHVACGTPIGHPRPNIYWLLNAELLKSSKGVRASDYLRIASEASIQFGAPRRPEVRFEGCGVRSPHPSVRLSASIDSKFYCADLYIDKVEKRHAGLVQCFACNPLGCAYDAALLTVVPVQISDQVYEEYPAEASTLHFPSQPPKRHNNRKNGRKHKGPKAPMIPPSKPNVTRMSDESVMVTWSHANHGLPIQFYKIQYREVNESANVQWSTANYDIPSHIHSYEIDQLKPDRYYKFRIAAVYSNQDNKLGKSSAKFYLQRGGFKGPKAPVLTKAVATSAISIQLDWTWSSEGGPQAAGFYVYYRVSTTAGAYEKVTVPGGASARSVVLSHLTPDTSYELKLQAYTEQAPSDFSSILVARTHKSSNAQSATTQSPKSSLEDVNVAPPGALVTAGGALGAAGLLVILVVTLLLCRRAKRPPANKEKGSVPEIGGPNGYIAGKVPITITANPMHAESGDSGVEMSFLHNNNCGNPGSNDDTLPHARKNGPTRQYV